jgi:prefoldin beta subunit
VKLLSSIEELPVETQHKLLRLQDLQERLKVITIRKSQYENELHEIQETIAELNNISDETPIYKSTGYVLVRVSRDKILNELNDKKDTLELHIKTLARQESVARAQIQELQKDLTTDLKFLSLSKSSGSR